ncbi:hypothetical protein [Candidatus Vondammii sp. HM_W22]|uniref:hypothetical protein n=1 Tax=Candidatus Vondammii sp. HM_W22 TaxID=2687299 RepID=UPI001F142514|nr:hypothetical protein [Candidatus Vondammii sp. HM_W22]
MKTLSVIILIIALAACSEQTPSLQMQKTESIFVLVENGGTIMEEDQEEALNTALHLFQQLTTLGLRKATKNTQIHIVLSALPNRIAWSGTPDQLLTQAEDVKNLITFNPSFSDLVMAFEQIETTVNLTQPDAIRIYWIGTTIHVPLQASGDKPIEVEVPQEVPSNLALSRLSSRLGALKIMRVHPDQDQILQAYLTSLGILERTRKGEIDFSLLGEAQTKSRLKTLL